MSETNHPGYVQPAQEVIEQINELQDEANLEMGRTNPPLSKKFQELLRNRKLIQ